MSEVEDELDEFETKPSKAPLIGGLVAGLVVGLGIGFGVASMAGGDEPDPAAEAELAAVVAPLNLGAFNINLRGGSRVLRVQIEVELLVSDPETMDSHTSRLRDTVLTVVSDYSHRDVEGMNGKSRLKEDLFSHFNTVMGDEGSVERVYFTQFVVQ